jgi:hypothetical protein
VYISDRTYLNPVPFHFSLSVYVKAQLIAVVQGRITPDAKTSHSSKDEVKAWLPPPQSPGSCPVSHTMNNPGRAHTAGPPFSKTLKIRDLVDTGRLQVNQSVCYRNVHVARVVPDERNGYVLEEQIVRSLGRPERKHYTSPAAFVAQHPFDAAIVGVGNPLPARRPRYPWKEVFAMGVPDGETGVPRPEVSLHDLRDEALRILLER